MLEKCMMSCKMKDYPCGKSLGFVHWYYFRRYNVHLGLESSPTLEQICSCNVCSYPKLLIGFYNLYVCTYVSLRHRYVFLKIRVRGCKQGCQHT